MTPATLARANTEHSHQRALFGWANMVATFGFAAANDEQSYTVQGYALAHYGPGMRLHAPVAALKRLYAIPNGGQRDKITAGKLKAEGVKRGVPDICLPLPMRDIDKALLYCGLYVEMKRPKVKGQAAGSTSEDQDDWIAYLRSVGYAVSVCFDWIAAAKEIQSYVEGATYGNHPGD